MKRAGFIVSLLSFMVLFAVFCSDKPTDVRESNKIIISQVSDCKNFHMSKIGNYVPPDQDCISYEYSGNKLTIGHLNAGFNCCTDFSVEVRFSGDTIIITESESGAFCHCLCLYDIVYEISDLERDQYVIKINEIYIDQDDMILVGELNLNISDTGQFCVERDYYPWDVGGTVSGQLIDFSDCGGFTEKLNDGFAPEDSACIIYEYSDSTGILNIRHQNSVFNCCPSELLAEISLSDDTIYIAEDENLDQGGCDCICPYDLDMIVERLTPGEYVLSITSPYLKHYDTELGEIVFDTLLFDLDLINSPEGYDCYEMAMPNL